jgi:nicotinate-nucleotide adenylyltransferase
MTTEKRRALFGGSFDPIHNGHLMIAEVIRQIERLDEVVFIPAAQSPHKPSTLASAETRVRLLRAALRGVPYFRCSRVEVDRPAPSFTIDTIRTFGSRWRQRPFLILGGDALLDLHSWRESAALLQECHPIVFARPGAPAAEQTAADLGLPYHAEALSYISSSSLRRMAHRGLSMRWQVPEAVRRIIESENLYAKASGPGTIGVERRQHS